jgi:alpha-galactosidase
MQGLLADLINSAKSWAVGLVDTDPVALETADGLARRMVQGREADITIERSTDRCDVLSGADVVVTAIAVGGRRAREADVLIPREYGIYQTGGETVMPGGISRAIRHVPALVAIARDVLRLCPKALFFNYTNPLTVICWAVGKATGADVVGLCIGTEIARLRLAEIIGAPPDQVTYLVAGVNHFSWIYDLRWRGQDAWPLVPKRLSQDPWEGTNPAADNPFSWSLFRTYGAYPAPNDSHVVEFFPERFPPRGYYGRTLGVDIYRFEEAIARNDARYARMKAMAGGEAPLDDSVFQHPPGDRQLVEILGSIEGDSRTMYVANVANHGAVPNLPQDAVLELTATATGRGLRALCVPDFPDALAVPMARTLAAQALTLEAALTGDRKTFVEALLVDGAVGNPAVASRLADELLRVHRQYLPQFE